MKETQLAETSKHDDARLQAAKEECQQLRQSLLAARKRILGLNTALANVADSIGTSLGLASGNDKDPARSANEESEASENDRHAGSPRATRSPTLEDTNANAIAIHLPVSINDIYDLDTTNMTDISDSALHSAVELFPWATNVPLTGSPASFGVAVTQRTNQENKTDNIFEELDRAQTTVSRHAELDIVDKLTNLSEMEIANFERAYLHDSRISSDSYVMSPPGNINFPSVFSGHLAACEYFIKQSKAYKQRRSKGGSER
ncbi:hypothetical protein LTR84_009138 [Exophiala bonariae]|uniref:Uncharacterized protein n=1 Tax=Exophiala bonariae TaxID=1690606 RepID=A0AAV9MYT9_9EURO|nr:hypothetical protein LTR84_009138 [Exophiala bonariae]